jgi:hypothetical protein
MVLKSWVTYDIDLVSDGGSFRGLISCDHNNLDTCLLASKD